MTVLSRNMQSALTRICVWLFVCATTGATRGIPRCYRTGPYIVPAHSLHCILSAPTSTRYRMLQLLISELTIAVDKFLGLDVAECHLWAPSSRMVIYIPWRGTFDFRGSPTVGAPRHDGPTLPQAYMKPALSAIVFRPFLSTHYHVVPTEVTEVPS